jgi:hypothetical protein
VRIDVALSSTGLVLPLTGLGNFFARLCLSRTVTRDGSRAKSGSVIDQRRQRFFVPAMLPMTELGYTGIVEKLKDPDKRLTVRRS